MADNSLFDSADIDALLDLVDVFESADPKKEIYNMSAAANDALNSIINKSSKYSPEDKKKLKDRFDIRTKNQSKVEKLSLGAEDIQRGKNILEGKIKDSDREI